MLHHPRETQAKTMKCSQNVSKRTCALLGFLNSFTLTSSLDSLNESRAHSITDGCITLHPDDHAHPLRSDKNHDCCVLKIIDSTGFNKHRACTERKKFYVKLNMNFKISWRKLKNKLYFYDRFR